jgi:hypothetical protein
MKSEYRRIQRGKVLPDDLANLILVNNYRPIRCLRLLYKYNSRHFKFVLRKLCVRKDVYKTLCNYFKLQKSIPLDSYTELVAECCGVGEDLCSIAEDDEFYFWLFSLSKKSREKILHYNL